MQIDYKIDRKAIGKRLKNERNRLGYTQESMAEAMGITSKYLSKVENGAAAPSLPYILKFTEITGADLNYLLLGKYPGLSGREGLIMEPPMTFDDPEAKLSKKNRRICNEMVRKMAEVLEEYNR